MVSQRVSGSAVARAHPNIAFIKYWGNRDDTLRLPTNSSFSMNLEAMITETAVEWDETLDGDCLFLNGQIQVGRALERVRSHLDALRERKSFKGFARVRSFNSFPTGAGIASSASSFAALTLAALAAAGQTYSERELSILARLGSGSASRSIPSGFVEWHAGDRHETSYAESIAPASHWAIADVIAVVSESHKEIGSTQGHALAHSSDLQDGRLLHVRERLRSCKEAVLQHDFEAFAEVVELDSNLMHAVMMTSAPSLFYWLPASVAVMREVKAWRRQGLGVCYTLDAGPNVHCICDSASVSEVVARLQSVPGVLDIRTSLPGSGCHLISSERATS